jgi:predicted O-methyltransferase YrrM
VNSVQVTDDLQEYLDSLLPPRDPVLARMEDEAHHENIPIVDAYEGAFLSLVVRISGAKRVLELGTAIGYSGIWLLRATSGGTLTTFETNHERAQRARFNFAEAGLANRVLVLEEDAVHGLEKLTNRFDVCFIDLLNSFQSEDVTRKVFDLCMQHLDAGGLLIADNALRQGQVVKPTTQQARNVAFYNQLVAKDSRLEAVVVPIRDGVSVARVKD